MIRYLLHFPDNTRAETMRYFMDHWREAEGSKAQIDVALAYGITVEKLPRVPTPAIVRRARSRAR